MAFFYALKKQMSNPADVYAWILYYDSDIHIEEGKIVRNAALESFILLQDVRKATNVHRPAWLTVLPALVDTKAKMAYRGPSCLKKLVTIDLPPEHLKRIHRLAKRRDKWQAI